MEEAELGQIRPNSLEHGREHGKPAKHGPPRIEVGQMQNRYRWDAGVGGVLGADPVDS